MNKYYDCYYDHTVPLKSKSKLEPRDSILEPRCSKRLSLEYRALSLEDRETRQKLERVSRKRFISRRENNTVRLTPISVSRESIRPYDSGLNDLPVNVDNPLRSEPLAKLLK